MKKYIYKTILVLYCICMVSIMNCYGFNPGNVRDSTPQVIMEEIRQMKLQMSNLITNPNAGGNVATEFILQIEKDKYKKNYAIVLRGIELINDLNLASREILTARSQNILAKKITDINNIQSDALGFQLVDIIIQAIKNNIQELPVEKPEKDRLINQVGNFVDVMKGVFPPLNIISTVISAVSSFTVVKSRVEKKSRTEDVIVNESTTPVNKEVLKKITDQLLPYIKFYDELNKANNSYEYALNQHTIQNKDYIESVDNLIAGIKSIIDLDNSIGEQVNTLFEIQKSSSPGFDFAIKNNDENLRKLVIACYAIFDLVDKHKKFTNDFINIQIDYYNQNVTILEKARTLPVKDDLKINQLIADLNSIRNGDAAKGLVSFEENYKKRLSTILNKLKKMNEERFK